MGKGTPLKILAVSKICKEICKCFELKWLQLQDISNMEMELHKA